MKDGTPAKTERKADLVARDLMSRIVRGELATGMILPTEDELAKRYETSRSVIREAIKLLEVHDLVRPIRRRGTEVLDPLKTLSADVVAAMLRPDGSRFDLSFLQGLLDVRATLDVHMVELVCKHRTKEDLALLQSALERVQRTRTKDVDLYTDAHALFSLALARATHNPVYTMLVHWNRRVVSELEELFRPIFSRAEQHAAGLAMLLDCIRKRDVASAKQLVTTFHDWLNPRLVAAAALANGENVRTVLKEVS
jgi:DNA-binding FadR family transcriptional regulator